MSSLYLNSQYGKISSFEAVEIPNNKDTFKLFVTQDYSEFSVIGMRHSTYKVQLNNLIIPVKSSFNLIK